jgi:lysophospholipase L1-like esterase
MNEIILILIVLLNLSVIYSLENSEYLYLLGRWSNNFESNWSNSGFLLNLSPIDSIDNVKKISNTLIIKFDSCTEINYYIESFVNDISQGRININPSNLMVEIDLPTSKNSIRIKLLKITEASFDDAEGIMKLQNISLSSDMYQFEKTNPNYKLKIQVFGDSLSCGYGDLGNYPCNFTAATESSQESWTTITSNYFNSELSQVTYSGKGVVRNYGDVNKMSDQPLPYFYNQTLAFDVDNIWDFTKYQANLVMILLGSNDYSTEPIPDNSSFIDGYTNFVKKIQVDYPSSTILLLCSPDQFDTPKCSNVETTAKLNNVNFLAIGATKIWNGCDYHPTIEQQKFMATQYIIPYVQELMNLDYPVKDLYN